MPRPCSAGGTRRALISPAEFITVAEDCGLIVPLGEWVLRAACRQNRAWQRLGLPAIRMAVNLDAVVPADRDLIDKILSCLVECDMQADYLELEITEGILMRDTETATTLLRRLSEEGISIAVDDFGTGYSSMAYLKRFPVSKIKIDRAFVADLTKDRGDAVIVNAIIKLGHGLGLRVLGGKAVERPNRCGISGDRAATNCRDTISGGRCPQRDWSSTCELARETTPAVLPAEIPLGTLISRSRRDLQFKPKLTAAWRGGAVSSSLHAG